MKFKNWGEWPIKVWLRCCSKNRKVPGSNPTRRGLGTQPHYQAPGDLWVKNVKCRDWFQLSEAAPSIMAQSWPWGSQIAVKKYWWCGSASKITYRLLWQFSNTKNKEEYILLYSTTFQDHFKIVRALPQLHQNYETFYMSNSRLLTTSFDTEKILPQVWCYKNSSWLIWVACTKII